jgi:hypothetical protein
MVYVGVDLHRKRAHVVALDPAGEVVLSRRIGNAPPSSGAASASSSSSCRQVPAVSWSGPAADRRHHRRVTHADAELRTQFASDPRIRRLLPIPGIGPVTAATVVAEVWEIGRFPAPERLCSWAGLTPGERTSDAPPAGATPAKQGSRWLPWMLVEAATSAVRDPHLGRFTGQIAQRRGPKITRVALARRLLTLCEDALRDQDGCRAYPALRGRSRRRGLGALGGCHGRAGNGRRLA